jgi:hypothetical protein
LRLRLTGRKGRIALVGSRCPAATRGRGALGGGAGEDLPAVEAIAGVHDGFLMGGKGPKTDLHGRVRNCRTAPRPPSLRGGRAARLLQAAIARACDQTWPIWASQVETGVVRLS